jgi:DNA-binding Lrp family transcriptional regulator
MHEHDQRDRELLSALQDEIPIVSTPFAVLGQRLDMSEKEVIKRTERLRREGAVRHLGAHFDSRALGYRSCLVAARVAEEKLDHAASVIGAHPGVTQNYRRNNDLNLWFTLYVSPFSKMGLEQTIDALGREALCDAIRALPTLKMYKSGTLDGGDGPAEVETSSEPMPLTPLEIDAVRLLQRELPLQPRPFDALSRGMSMSADDLINAARALRARGQLRRLTATIVPKKSGFSATAMGVWQVPSDRADSYALQFVKHRSVSHCYLRPVYDDWPFNLYTTVHARSVDECESIINDLAADTGIQQRQTLFPIREYKKARLSFFSPEAEAWEASRASQRAAAVS